MTKISYKVKERLDRDKVNKTYKANLINGNSKSVGSSTFYNDLYDIMDNAVFAIGFDKISDLILIGREDELEKVKLDLEKRLDTKLIRA